MSFGISVGDFLAVLRLAQSVRGKWIDAPPEYASIKNEIKNVENVLRDINELETQIELTPREIQNLHDASSSCLPVLELCNTIVDKYVSIADLGSGSRNRVRRSWKRFKLDPDDIRHARDQLSSLVTQLTAIEGVIQIRATSDMQDAVDVLQQSDDRREREQIAEWYAPASFAVQRNEYSKVRQRGTGAWFLHDDRYIRWRDNQNTASHSTLLCPGIPGSGKTMMATAVVDDLHTLLENEENCVVAYFYCNYNRREQQDLDHIYSSLVRQLFQEQQSIPGEVKDLYLKHRDRQTRPSIDELEALLRLLAQRHRRVYVVIDALDEYNTDNLTRDQLLHELFDIQNGPGTVSLLATTRFIPEIMQKFTACEQIEVRAAREDIQRYLDNRMGELASFVRRKVDLQQEIKSQIVTLVDGMFLLARLHFEALLGYTNATKLRQALRGLPSGKDALKRAYDTARERIDHQSKPQADLARHVLTWVSGAKRELEIEELREAVAISMTPGKTDIDHENDLDEPDEIISVCAGLVVLDSQTGIIRLVHYTTQEYIDNVHDQWLPNAQIDIVRSCIAYLSLDAFLLEDIVWRIDLTYDFQQYKLLSYVGDHWGDHVREIDGADVQDQVLQFLCDKRRTCFASQVTRVSKGSAIRQCNIQNISSLHICAFFDMAVICSHLIVMEKSCDPKDSEGQTPLSWAAVRNCVDTLQLLLRQSGIDVNARDVYDRTALNRAALRGQKEAVELLLRQPGIEVNTKDQYSKTALLQAAGHGYKEIVELLLRQPRIDVNTKDRYGGTPLAQAAEHGHKEVVELLLRQPGIEVNTKYQYGGTPLAQAAGHGHKEVVELLLCQPGIDVNTKDRFGGTALVQAVEYRYKEIVELLLRQPGIEVNTKYQYGGTPLAQAAGHGHKEVVELLLCQPGIDVNTKDRFGGTALVQAAEHGHKAVVELLLRQPGIEVNTKDRFGGTALVQAAEHGQKEVVELLLRQLSIDINATNDMNETTLINAVAGGYKGIVELLLHQPGINVNLKDEYGWTALTRAVAGGYKDMVELLLRHPSIDINIKNEDGNTALSLALAKRYGQIAALLQQFSTNPSNGEEKLSWR